MELKVAYRFAQMSPQKVRLVIDMIRGRNVDDALNVLRLTRKRASTMIAKLLKSAVASAAELHDAAPEDMVVRSAWVDNGPTRKGWWARPRGMGARLRYRSSHIHLVVATTEEEDAPKVEASRG